MYMEENVGKAVYNIETKGIFKDLMPLFFCL